MIMNIPHTPDTCLGNCPQHPLMTGLVLEMRDAFWRGATWGGMAYDDTLFAIANENETQRAQRLKADADADAASAAAITRFSVNKKADKWTKGGEMKFRVPRPCKYASLFLARTCAGCQAQVPEGQTHCQAKKGHLVCGQELAGCWSHEHSASCIYIHPDEPQWPEALNGTLDYDRGQRIFFIKGQRPVNRFEVTVREHRHERSPLGREITCDHENKRTRY